MAVFHGFRALRPVPEKAEKVAALPYDVVSRRRGTFDRREEQGFFFARRP